MAAAHASVPIVLLGRAAKCNRAPVPSTSISKPERRATKRRVVVARGLEPERDALGDSAETSEVCGGFADVWGSGLWVLGARVPHAEASRRGFAEMHGIL